MHSTKYSVVLNILPGNPHAGFLEQFASKITSEDGSYRLCLWCSEVDTTLPNYLSVLAVHESSETARQSYHLKIPHHLVLMIGDSFPKDSRVWGFSSSETS